MKPFATLGIVLLPLLLGCGGGASFDPSGAILGIPAELEIDFLGGPICCAERPGTGKELGQVRISHTGPPGSPAWVVDVGPWSSGLVYNGLEVDAEIDPRPVQMGSGDILLLKVLRIHCNWDVTHSDIRFTDDLNARYLQRVALNNSCLDLTGLLDVVEGIVPQVDEVALIRNSVIRAVISVAVPWSAPHIAPQVPIHLWTEIRDFGIFLQKIFFDELVAAFGAIQLPKPAGPGSLYEEFPCGSGLRGHTVCPDMPAAMPEGDYVFAYLSVDEDIPLASSRLITYGFVFDADGNPANNYIPHPAYPDDYFKDSDRWYTLEYTPTAGWSLLCRDATNSVINEVATGAKAVISGNIVLLVVPAAEFSVPDPRYRVTAFTHTGDFGENPPHDWSGDQHPRVSDGLAPFVRQD